MQARHINRSQYFKEQIKTTENYVIPFISSVKKENEWSSVLEIGCGEGGNMVPFLDRGCRVVGVDLSQFKIDRATEFFEGHKNRKNLALYLKDIYELDEEGIGQFDLIIMRDVIEHIHNQEKFMDHLKCFLKPEGVVFFGFPPWQMPFGGHQQSLKHNILSKVPYYHLLPKSIYSKILQLGGESKEMIDGRLEIVDTGISIERFRRIAQGLGYTYEKEDLYFINPNYEAKFGLRPRIQLPVLTAIPYVRNFVVTCVYALISINHIQNNE